MTEKFYVFEGKKKRLAVELKCSYCNNNFLKAKHLLKYNQVNYFCSRNCESNYFKTGNIIKCDYCQKEFYRTKSKQQNKFNFCSRKCKDLAQQIYSNNDLDKFKEMRPSHYKSVNEIFNYRLYAFSLKEHKCERCGYCANEAALQVHHKDYNHKNNKIDNLEILCANCHAIEHFNK